MRDIKIRQIIQILLVVGITVLAIRLFFIDSFIVKGDSMAPAVLDNDYVFVDKISRYFRSFKRGDIIVVKTRSLGNQVIKRIIGLPEERVEIAENQVWIKNNRQDPGEILFETYISGLATPSIGLNMIQLDPKEYFILGDNRYASIDSRELGPVDEWSIKGRVFLVLSIKSLSIKIF